MTWIVIFRHLAYFIILQRKGQGQLPKYLIVVPVAYTIYPFQVRGGGMGKIEPCDANISEKRLCFHHDKTASIT